MIRVQEWGMVGKVVGAKWRGLPGKDQECEC
jgi:hypothetical protein